MTLPTLSGITSKTISSDRITTRVLFSGSDGGVPVLFLHGNLSSATWWEEVMVALPDGFQGIAPDQRGFGDSDIEKKIDARRGMGDLADDAAALAGHHCGRCGNQHQAAGTQLRARCFSGRRGIGGEYRQCRQHGEQAAQQQCAAYPGAGRLDHRNNSLERCDERYT